MATGKFGRWIEAKSLSEGAQAHTFLVEDGDREFEGRYVLKRLKNLNRLGRFRQEIEAVAKLRHKNVVSLVDFDIESPKPFLVTEFCSGGTLEDADFSSWETQQFLELFYEVLEGVAHAHEHGIVHRDLKPQNIFLRSDGKTPVIGDFGICFISESGGRFTLSGEAVGARRFTAPELEDGPVDDVSKRSDVYSLGKILYWLFRGKVFDREKHRNPGWNLTGETVDLYPWRIAERAFVNELLDKSIRENPSERFGSAIQFKAWVHRTKKRVTAGACVTDLSERLRCIFCGNGEYRRVVNQDDESTSVGRHKTEGDTVKNSMEWLRLECDNCGNAQKFRLSKTTLPNWRGLNGRT